MNSREKYVSALSCIGNNYKIPKVEFGYWFGTIRNWFKEGLPIKKMVSDTIPDAKSIYGSTYIDEIFEEKRLSIYNDINVREFFELDYDAAFVPIDFSALLPQEVLEKNDTHLIYRDPYGCLLKNNVNMNSLPMDIDSPVKDWKSWHEYKQYYSTDTIKERLPENWNDISRNLKNRAFPLKLGRYFMGFLGFPRKIMGLSNYLVTLYDDPKLIHDICDTLLKFLMALFGKVSEDVDADYVLIWEDMSGKQGSLISPAHFKEFLMPRYKKLVRFVKELGVKNIIIDTDGNVENLIPLLIESGITGMFPFERAAGNDLLKLRKSFPNFQFIGGIDKRVLFKDSNKKRIDDELDMVKEMLKYGRYIPHIDHLASEDCKWEYFHYYRNRLNNIIDNLI